VNLLAIDASTEACSVALQLDNQVISEFELCPQSHSIVLLPMIDRLLKKSNCQLSDFDALVYGQGPGSFTGVRIGIGVAQGLAFSASLPTIGVSTMQAMAQQAYSLYKQQAVSVAIDARMSEIYCANWQLSEEGIMELIGAEQVIAPQKFAQQLSAPVYGAGTGWQAYREALENRCVNIDDVDIQYPNAQYMLPAAIKAFNAGHTLPAEQAQPVYVRDTVSWKKLPGRE